MHSSRLPASAGVTSMSDSFVIVVSNNAAVGRALALLFFIITQVMLE